MENFPNPENQIFQREQISPAEAKYKEAYEKSLELWDKPYQRLMVETRFGRTHVIERGPKQGEPLILLPGMSASSVLWYPNVSELSHKHLTLALDVPGDAGMSEAGKPPQNRREYAQWLVDVLNYFHIDKADFAGLSYGGNLALNFATLAPERVKKLTLLAPAGWIKLESNFRANMYKAWFLRSKGAFKTFIKSMSVRPEAINDPVMDQMYTNFRYLHRRPKALPEIIPDNELRQMQVPTLFLVGDREVIYRPEAAIERAKIIPGAQTEIIPGAGHMLPYDRPQAVNERIISFLGR